MPVRAALVSILLSPLGCRSVDFYSSAPTRSVDSVLVAPDGVQLAYSVDLPGGRGPFPAVVLVHGSGRVTRGDELFLSRQFTSHGWAVLRYDKRGVGESGGVYSGVSVANSVSMIGTLASDAAAALRTLAAYPQIDRRRVGFAGGSQAGWIIPAAIVAEPQARMAVILVGPTVSVGTEIFYSDVVENSAEPLEAGYRALLNFSGPHGFDPLPLLRQIRVPVLWLYGAEDRSIPTRTCVMIHDQLRQTLAPPFTVRVYDRLGHALDGSIWPDVYAFLDAIPR